jgi:hypothetical protein
VDESTRELVLSAPDLRILSPTDCTIEHHAADDRGECAALALFR